MRHLTCAALALASLALAGPLACASTSAAGQKPDSSPAIGLGNPRVAERAVTATTAPGAGTVAITGATLLLGTGARIEGGTVVMSGGRITAVGPASAVQTPAGATVIDGRGKFVTPGIIDTHSHLGVYAPPDTKATADGNEMTDPTTPYVFSEHAFWTQDPQIQRAVAGGVTTIQVLPGSGNVIGGRATTLKLKPAIEARAMRFPGAPYGLKMACGENPKRVYGDSNRQPMSRMGSVFRLRQAFLKAQMYRARMVDADRTRARWEASHDGPEPLGLERDLGLETLADALDGKILVHVHCYRADEMMLVLSLARELGFKVSSFHHAVEAYKIADVLAREGVAASMWADWWGFKLEAWDSIEENIPMVAAAGGRAIVHSDSGIGIQRLNQEAAKALYAGQRAGLAVTEDDAIVWMTKNPAVALGIADQTGTLEVGKMADVVLWDHSPLSIYAAAEQVFIDGARVYDRSAPGARWSDFEVGTSVEEVRP